MLANVVVATLAAPGIVSLAPEAGVRLQESHAQAMDTAMFAADGGGEFQGFADLSFGQSEIEGNAWHPGTDGDATTFTLGGTFHPSDRAKVGLGVSISSYDTDLNGAGGIDGTGVLASIGGEYSFDVAYLSGSLFGGTTRAEISRSIQIGLVNRVESGETSMSQHGASLGAGLRFGNDSFRHGPFASVTWHRISVAGYDEDGDLSTAMNYEDFDRDSVIGRIGYQLRGNLGGDRSMSPYLRVAYAMETEDQATVVNAGSNSMNGRFELPGFTPSEDWIEADLGLSMQFGENTVGALSYRGTFADDQVENGSFNLTVSTNF
jgi:outer membrane lipase/esterase